MKVRWIVLLMAVIGAAGCKPRAVAPDEAMPPAPSGEPATQPAGPAKSIDDQIAEILKDVDPTLIYERVPIPDEENAWPLWAEAMEKLVAPDETVKKLGWLALKEEASWPEGKSGRRLEHLVAANREALERVDAGLRRGRCQYPETRRPQGEPRLFPLVEAAKIKCLKARMLAVTGGIAGASEELAGALQMGDMADAGALSLLSHMVAVTITDTSVKNIRWLAKDQRVTDADLVRLIGGLGPRQEPASGLARALRVELRSLAIVMFEEKPKALKYPGELTKALEKEKGVKVDKQLLERLFKDLEHIFDKAETIRIQAVFYARLIRSVEGPWKDRDQNFGDDAKELVSEVTAANSCLVSVLSASAKGNRELDREEMERAKDAVKNIVGRSVVAIALPNMAGLVEPEFRYRADRAATRTVLALRLYEIRKGRLPDSLRTLVDEKILEAVPVDPFSDKPLRYSRERRVVWSVGPNETDDGGRLGGSKPGFWRGKDYVLRVPGSSRPAPPIPGNVPGGR